MSSLRERSSIDAGPTLFLMWVIVAIGALNWGLVGLWDYDLVVELIGSANADTVYIAIGGIAAVNLLDIAGVLDLDEMLD